MFPNASQHMGWGWGRKNAVPTVEYVAPSRAKPSISRNLYSQLFWALLNRPKQKMANLYRALRFFKCLNI